MTARELIEQLKEGTPFKGLRGVSVISTSAEQKKSSGENTITRPDVRLEIDFSGVVVTVLGEIKTQITPKVLEQVGPWLARIKRSNPKEIYILICPFLSPTSQKYCQENEIDFIDMSGNVFIQIPGKVVIQRLGQPNKYKEKRLFRNPFGGISSRVVRVLLQFPQKKWTITAIQKELQEESERQKKYLDFNLSLSSISKTVQSLEEELLIRRDGLQIAVPEPSQLLFRWSEKYKERYKWAKRSAWKVNNPYGLDIKSSVNKLLLDYQNLDYVITGATAANLIAPFVDIDRIDIFILPNQSKEKVFQLKDKESVGPDFYFIYPYDNGVFIYANKIDNLLVASDIQTYLDCYARGGRDLKQADYLLSNVIEKRWGKND